MRFQELNNEEEITEELMIKRERRGRDDKYKATLS